MTPYDAPQQVLTARNARVDEALGKLRIYFETTEFDLSAINSFRLYEPVDEAWLLVDDRRDP